MTQEDNKAALRNLFITGQLDEENRRKAWELIIDTPQIRHDENVVLPEHIDQIERSLINAAVRDPSSVAGADRALYLGQLEYSLRSRKMLQKLGLTEPEILVAQVAADQLLSDISIVPRLKA